MKTLKLAAFALTLGLFAASCGGSTETTTETVDSTTTVEAPVETAPVEPTPAPATDTTATSTTTTTTTTTADTTKK